MTSPSDSAPIELKEQGSAFNLEQLKSSESSLGQDLSTFSSQSSKFDNDTSEIDELLQHQHLKGGCFGALERLPLFVKLFMMLVLALVGVIGLSAALIGIIAKDVQKQRISKSTSILTQATSHFLNQIQKERDVGYNYMVTRDPEIRQTFTAEMEHTDGDYKLFMRNVTKQTLAYRYAQKEMLSEFENIYKFLPFVRDDMLNAPPDAFTRMTLFNQYSNATDYLSKFMTSFTSVSSSVRLMNSVTQLQRLIDNVATTRSMVCNVLLFGMSDLRYRFIVQYGSNEQLIDTFIQASADSITLESYQESVVYATAEYSALVNSLIANQNYPIQNVTTYAQWWDLANSRIGAIALVVTETVDRITADAEKQMRKSAGAVVAIIVVVVVLLLFSIGAAILFSRAITAPWKRLIMVQELTIKKFVPKGLLRILKCYRLSDVVLGKSVERELTVMFADIRNYTGMSENMTPSQNFAFLNKYLACIGPVVRRHGGYIDKFLGDGIMACFPNTQNGLKASLELQDAVNRLNLENPSDPVIRVGVGVHTGKVMVGAIGEDERMEGTMISDAVNLTSRLETLTKAFRAKVLTTSESLKRLKSTSEYPHRPIGYVKVKGKKQFVKVYELIDRKDQGKMETIKSFKTAVDSMIHHNYEHALVILEEICQKQKDDIGAQRVRSSCQLNYEIFKDQVKNLTVQGALQDSAMKQSFVQFCAEERSEENVKFWIEIEEFRKTEDDIKRILLAKKIFSSYLSHNAKHQVNTSDDSKKNIMEVIKNYDEQLIYPSTALFNELQTEIEILMKDTFTRFKNSSHFVEAYRKSIPAPLVHVMDEDTM